MKKTVVAIIALALCIPVIALAQQTGGLPALMTDLQNLKTNLQSQIDQLNTKLQNIQLTPGPPGPQGPAGSAGVDSIATLNGTPCTAFDGSSSSLVVTISQPGTYSLTCPSTSPTGSKIVFITSQSYTGNLNGLAGADSICQNLAINANLPGVYKAWLSDSTQSPQTRFTHSAVPYKRVDGVAIAQNWTELTNYPYQPILAAINVDEHGLVWTTENYVWTFTQQSGSVFGPFQPIFLHVDCNDWTSADPGSCIQLQTYSGWCGATGQYLNVNNWTWGGPFESCDSLHHLYCFQQ